MILGYGTFLEAPVHTHTKSWAASRRLGISATTLKPSVEQSLIDLYRVEPEVFKPPAPPNTPPTIPSTPTTLTASTAAATDTASDRGTVIVRKSPDVVRIRRPPYGDNFPRPSVVARAPSLAEAEIGGVRRETQHSVCEAMSRRRADVAAKREKVDGGERVVARTPEALEAGKTIEGEVARPRVVSGASHATIRPRENVETGRRVISQSYDPPEEVYPPGRAGNNKVDGGERVVARTHPEDLQAVKFADDELARSRVVSGASHATVNPRENVETGRRVISQSYDPPEELYLTRRAEEHKEEGELRHRITPQLLSKTPEEVLLSRLKGKSKAEIDERCRVVPQVRAPPGVDWVKRQAEREARRRALDQSRGSPEGLVTPRPSDDVETRRRLDSQDCTVKPEELDARLGDSYRPFAPTQELGNSHTADRTRPVPERVVSQPTWRRVVTLNMTAQEELASLLGDKYKPQSDRRVVSQPRAMPDGLVAKTPADICRNVVPRTVIPPGRATPVKHESPIVTKSKKIVAAWLRSLPNHCSPPDEMPSPPASILPENWFRPGAAYKPCTQEKSNEQLQPQPDADTPGCSHHPGVQTPEADAKDAFTCDPYKDRAQDSPSLRERNRFIRIEEAYLEKLDTQGPDPVSHHSKSPAARKTVDAPNPDKVLMGSTGEVQTETIEDSLQDHESDIGIPVDDYFSMEGTVGAEIRRVELMNHLDAIPVEDTTADDLDIWGNPRPVRGEVHEQRMLSFGNSVVWER
ncbi:hypothetical protein FN846DRAFT_312845 [Sphaerosporella brunnea]|uniref:Uncharacterized protein n=1 Tax=Sphaerosporella brunnea TaxID=1250544 RepID=A0A5J5EKZ2_9PEZI|nr:hypothetical protein FN846DRAFT_312845 [Sphaerosporella brunnea]